MVTKNCIQLFAVLFVGGITMGSGIAQPKLPLDSLHPPKPDKPLRVEVKSIQQGDVLAIKIDAPSSRLFTLQLLTHEDSLLSSLQVTGGTTLLPAFPVGHYHFKLRSDSGSVVQEGKFDVRPKPAPPVPHLKARIVPGNPIQLLIETDSNQRFILYLKNHQDSLLATVAVHGGINVLASIAEGHYHYDLLDDSGRVVFNGKFDVRLPKPKPLEIKFLKGDSLSVWIDAPDSSLFVLDVLSHEDSLLTTIEVRGGTNTLPSLPIGHYHYVLKTDSGLVVKKGKFDVRGPKVHAVIAPNPSFTGQGALHVHAPASEQFTLLISNASTLLHSLQITGGNTAFPPLAAGIYYYQVLDSSGQAIAKGRIVIME